MRQGNCLLFALMMWMRHRRGRIAIIAWGSPWPHFAWLDGDELHHLMSVYDESWLHQLWYRGVWRVSYGGE